MNRVDICLKYQAQFDGLIKNKKMALEQELINEKNSANGILEKKKQI